MANRVTDSDLQIEVQATIDHAISQGSPVSKADIARRFRDRGTARSTLYLWIDRYLLEVGVSAATKPGPVAVPIHEVVTESAVRVMAARNQPIPYGQRLHNSLLRSDALRAMAYGPEGEIQNIRLVMDTDEGERKKLQTAAFIQEKLAAAQQQMHSLFMDEVLNLIWDEIPERRDYLLQRIDEIRTKYGALR